MYQTQLEALKRAGRFRERKIFDRSLIDLASNDYLGLASNKKQFRKAVELVGKYDRFAPKASMLVNGYHPIHRDFEDKLAELNGFESGLVVGSGFLANLSLIESLVRKGDRLFIDSEYHASGMMATGLLGDRVVIFAHNDMDDLRDKLKLYRSHRTIIAVEGVYSMSGELCKREVFDIADRVGALLIVDEAHSSGVVGESLLGVFEHYEIPIASNHIKMGTLGKAYGSYGAYILASGEIVSFLENRAKPIIYSTAPSIFDTALALVNIEHIARKSKKYYQKIQKRLRVVHKVLGIESHSLILSIPQSSNSKTMEMQRMLMDLGYLVGAIRQPTVDRPILRVIPRVGVSIKEISKLLEHIDDLS